MRRLHAEQLAHRAWAFVLGMLVLAGVVRLWGIGARSFWLDETISVVRTSGSFRAMLSDVMEHDAHPPLYYSCLHVWRSLTGSGGWPPEDAEGRIRALSALFSVLTVLMTYKLGAAIFGKRTGLVAALMLSVSAYSVHFAQEARLHALVTFLVTGSLYFCSKLALRKARIRTRDYVCYAVFTVAALYTFYYTIFVIVAECCAFCLVWKRSRRSARGWALCLGLALLCFAPYLPVVRRQYLRAKELLPPGARSTPVAARSVRDAAIEYALGRYEPVDMAVRRDAGPQDEGARQVGPFGSRDHALRWLVAVTALAPLVVAFWLLFRRERLRHASLCLSFLLGPVVCLAVLPMRPHIFESKHLVFLNPLYFVVIASVVSTTSRRLVPVALLAVVMVINLYAICGARDLAKEDWRAAARFLEEREQPEDEMLLYPAYLAYPLGCYYRGGLHIPAFGRPDAASEKDAVQRRDRTSRAKRVWVVQVRSNVCLRQIGVLPQYGNRSLTSSLWLPGLCGDIHVALYERQDSGG